MGDSDEEYDRRRARDKFRRERSDYQERGREERGRRDDWSESRDGRGSRREYRDYDPRNRRDRYSPARHDISPPMKRMRRDWEDRGSGYGNNFEGNFPPGGGGGGGGMMGGMHAGWGMNHGQMNQQQPQREVDVGLTQPPMMTFKQFLSSQDDGIDDQEAVKKYNEYKLEFKRQQINEFFLAHKDEEWFKLKHHPEESTKRKEELREGLKRRLAVFMELFEKSWVDGVKIDQENTELIIKFLDAVVIKLEGGTDFDLKVLDQPYEEEKPKETTLLPANKDDKKEANSTEEKVAEVEKPKKRKHSHSSHSGEDSSSGSDSDSDSNPPDDNVDENDESRLTENGVTIKKEKDPSPRPQSRSGSEKEDSMDKDDSSDVKENATVKEEMEDSYPDKDSVEKDTEVEVEEQESTEKPDEDAEKDEGETVEDIEPKPRALHKTHSIFLRYLAPSITKQEVEAMCKRFPGFLRVAIADPQPERRFVRRAWVTFERTVNIKEMCWKLNGIRLRDSELGAIVNRDLSRRIRSVNGISSHKQVVRCDIKLAARIIQNLDRQKKLWEEEEQKKEEEFDERGFLLASKNPLLKNITDYLIEEASAEEDELLGMGDNDENKTSDEGWILERDESIIKVLDRLLLYLRVIHSVDYYNSSEYPSEDEMPNRCGIMHARGSPPSSRVTPQEINDYIAHFEVKSQIFLQTPTKLDDEECVKLGKKDAATEVEKFIVANTQELAKDKWLCPLSGKKFKGPEFVRKHIHNKHAEKIEDVQKEVEYFNNYLMDPKRAQLPEHPANRAVVPRNENMPGNMGGPPFHGGPFPPPMPHYFGPRGPGPSFGGFGGQNFGRGPDMFRAGGYGKRNNFNRRSPRSDPRKMIQYRDLDAPDDTDVF